MSDTGIHCCTYSDRMQYEVLFLEFSCRWIGLYTSPVNNYTKQAWRKEMAQPCYCLKPTPDSYSSCINTGSSISQLNQNVTVYSLVLITVFCWRFSGIDWKKNATPEHKERGACPCDPPSIKGICSESLEQNTGPRTMWVYAGHAA